MVNMFLLCFNGRSSIHLFNGLTRVSSICINVFISECVSVHLLTLYLWFVSSICVSIYLMYGFYGRFFICVNMLHLCVVSIYGLYVSNICVNVSMVSMRVEFIYCSSVRVYGFLRAVWSIMCASLSQIIKVYYYDGLPYVTCPLIHWRSDLWLPQIMWCA